MAFSVEFFKYLKKIRILKKNVDEKSLILKNYDIKKKNFFVYVSQKNSANSVQPFGQLWPGVARGILKHYGEQCRILKKIKKSNFFSLYYPINGFPPNFFYNFFQLFGQL